MRKYLPSALKKCVRNFFNNCGYAIIPLNCVGDRTLLGIKKLPVKTILDIGANTGQFARKISSSFPDAEIYSFEPLPEPFEDLANWAESYSKTRVKPFNLALGTDEGDFEIYNHTEHSPSSSFLKNTEVGNTTYPFTQKHIKTTVKATTLDTWAQSLDESLEDDILIKLDVQGFEDRVIKGGAETFAKAKACILEVGIDQLYEGQATFKDISMLLFSHGFKYIGNLSQRCAADGHVIYLDAVFSK